MPVGESEIVVTPTITQGYYVTYQSGTEADAETHLGSTTLEGQGSDAYPVITLPEPANLGFTAPAGKNFHAWSYTMGSEQINLLPGETATVESALTLTAVWTDDYSITVTQTSNMEGCVLILYTDAGKGLTAAAGQTVYIDWDTPQTGNGSYYLDRSSLTVTCGDTTVTVNNDEDYPFFVMPEGNVTITATFVYSV